MPQSLSFIQSSGLKPGSCSICQLFGRTELVREVLEKFAIAINVLAETLNLTLDTLLHETF
jgi:hypothetical protein